MKINVKTSDKIYGQALALTLARCLKADVVLDAGPEFEADFNLCDSVSEECYSGEVIVVSKFEPVSKLVDKLRSSVLEEEGMRPVNVKAVAVTGMGGSGVSTVASIGAAVASELYGKRVLLVSFNGIGGPTQRQVYDLLTKGTLNLGELQKDNRGVLRLDGGQGLNPLGRLSRGEIAEILFCLGRIPGQDLIVLDVPVASPHWPLCMKAAENIVVVGKEGKDKMSELINEEVSGLNRILFYDNPREQGTPDLLSETGAAVRRFVQEELC